MKTLILYLTLAVFSLSVQLANAQVNDSIAESKSSDILEQKREEIRKSEKGKLKYKIERYEAQVESGQITREEAEKLMAEAAEFHALNIKNKIAIMENEFEYESRNEHGSGYIALSEDGLSIKVNTEREKQYDKRTVSDMVLAVGFNNALSEGQSLNDSDFKIGGSRFFEIGWAWKTRVFDNSNWLRFKYGLSFQFNGLKPTDNRYFVEEDGVVSLQEFDYNLNKSKFRMDNLVVPLHFEFGPSKKKVTENTIRYSTDGKLKVGLGGFAGLNIGERQKLKYDLDGEKQKDKLKGDYATNDFVYGLSGYLGWGGATLYAKYDLNPIFKSPNAELHNFSVGLRFDVD